MEELASVINNFARLILYAGGGVFTIAVCVAGFFYMTAFGDPQKQNIARGALVGAFVGVCIMGVSFLAPRIMSQFVLEPAGLEGVANSGNTGCDRTLRSALITQRGVGNAQQVNSMVRAIQAQRANDCNAEVWNPFAFIEGDPPGSGNDVSGDGFDECSPALTAVDDPFMIGQTNMPSTLKIVSSSRVGDGTYGGFARDSSGNIVVEFATEYRPTDGSDCWMYIAQSNYWDQSS